MEKIRIFRNRMTGDIYRLKEDNVLDKRIIEHIEFNKYFEELYEL